MRCTRSHSAPSESACLAKVDGYRVLPTSQQECAATYRAGAYDLTACNLTHILYTRGDAIGVGRHFAAMTMDEAASVTAFRRL